MSTLLIVIVTIAVLAVAGAFFYGVPALRRQRLQRRFGPEYDRALGQFGSRREAERNLAERERRFRDLDIRELPADKREKYEEAWSALQEKFVESPAEALGDADALITRVMHDRGYPTGARERRMEILSVEYGRSLDRYRQAREIDRLNEAGKASTEDLRQALLHHRMLFTELLGRTPDAVARGK
ncbi:MAG TPA: hypothetical protein VLH10_15410 [Yinghuangia sp.]|uniref:hypothetical protein n=1 Tax=Yinghuangia sp. YIM S10712 TaxID=3436930 RepID=UPI002D0453BD|nr:hypothetical protein [Yinghuangia sp.]